MDFEKKYVLLIRDQLQQNRNDFCDETNITSQKSFTGHVQGHDRYPSTEQGQVFLQNSRDDSLVCELASLQPVTKCRLALRNCDHQGN